MDDLTKHRKRRLRDLIAAHPFGGNQNAFAAKADLSEGRISQLLSESSAFGERSAARIAQNLTLPDRYFEEGFVDGAASGSFDHNAKFVTMGKREYPVISYIQAGAVTDIHDPYSPGDGFDVEVGDDVWSKWTFGLELEGESMLPEFREKDRVLIDPTLAPNPGDYVAAKNSQNQATFKKYRVRGVRADGKEVFELVPLNPDFPTVRSDEEALQIIGVMVEHRKRYRSPASRKTIRRGRVEG